MFTGIVHEVGELESVDRTDAGARVRVRAALAAELGEGDSIAVEGVCLTAAAIDGTGFEADVMNQTLALTTLSDLAAGDPVNLEPALRAGDPLGGHIVQGHVDAVGEVVSVVEDGIARRIAVGLPDGCERFVVELGSVTLAGVSLTVAALDGETVEVSLIPETLERTTLGAATPGKKLNIELDLIARYVDRLLGFRDEGGGR